MPVPDLIRESFVGQLIYNFSGKRYFQYAEERPGFVCPRRFDPARRASWTGPDSEAATLSEKKPIPEQKQKEGEKDKNRVSVAEREEGATDTQDPRSRSSSDPERGIAVSDEKPDPNLVDWYGPDDPEHPMNWSLRKRCFVTFNLCLLTFSIYIGSAIYAPGIEDVAQKFGVSDVAATLGLTMFVVGYGVGPMFLSPLSEIPQFGRTNVYILSLLVFVVLQVPTALCKNLGALIPLRFLAGFAGSPPLATGGASLADMWAPEDRAVSIGLWGLAAVCGPVLGPLLGGFATQAEGWTWTIWILLWLSGASLVYLCVFLPETSSQTILHRRAVRLRRLTGNHALRTQAEIDAAHMTMGEVAQMTLIRPFVLCVSEPIVLFWNLYIALVYGIIYIFIASFNVVFIEGHGFNLGENGLAFMGLFVGALVTYAGFVPYAVLHLKPMFKNGIENFIPEERLPVAWVGSIFLPISLFWFGWTAAPSIPWIVPIIGSGFFTIGAFLLFQAGLNYLSDCYPRYVASVLAGNDFFRSMVGAAFPLFSTAFFHNLGVGQACSVLGGIAVAMLPIPFFLYKYGARIRSWSKYAD
ncbi:hypothetical protein NM688_g6530 [Phlebia brevispora]|uniref:Uncharacterized protein n=1 Tax=Phlebia brevispora TaxID=194682 RepID=A0ACC1SEY9_9APHY|nr:hypothetical protein NM688_g6530 [Phlebia brevispora]